MQYEIYADSLFLIVFLVNFSLLEIVNDGTYHCAGLIRRLLVSVFFSGLFLFSFGGGKWYLIRLLGCVLLPVFLLPLMAFPVSSFQGYIRCLECFLRKGALLGGILYAVLRLSRSLQNFLYIDFIILLLMPVILRAMKYLNRWSLRKNTTCEVIMQNGCKKISLYGLLDTGNELREPISRMPVCIVPEAILPSILEEQNLYRVVPYHSVGGTGILYAYQIEKMCITIDGVYKYFYNVYVAGAGAKNTGDRIILNPALLHENKKMIKGKKMLQLWDEPKTIFSFFRKETVYIGTDDEIHYIQGAEVLPAPLEPGVENEVINNLGTEKEEDAKAILIEHNLRLVVYIAKKFDNTGVGVEDLISIGTIGLIKSINTFKPCKKIKLATYASRCIENEILMYLRRNNKTRLEVSIDEPLNVDWDGNELLLSDILGTDEDVIYKNIESEVERKVLLHALKKLSKREQTIISLRFGLGTRDGQEMTQKEVAALLGISQSYISRLEKRIMRQLKREMIGK